MSFSKPISGGDVAPLKPKTIEEYMHFKCDECVSIDVIYNYVGGEKMEYLCCTPEQGRECFEYSKKTFLAELNESKMLILVGSFGILPNEPI